MIENLYFFYIKKFEIFFKVYIYIPFPLINLKRMAITAITNKMWMIFPTLYTKKPSAQSITRITAIVYNRFCMTFFFRLD